MFIDLLKEVFDSIRRNKFRASATGFAVMSGIFLLIVLLGAGNGLIHTIENNSGQMALDAIYLYPGTTERAYAGYQEGRNIRLAEDDGSLARKLAPENIRNVSALYQKSVTVVTDENHSLSTTFNGADEHFLSNMSFELKFGRAIHRRDVQDRRKIVLLGEKLCDRLYGKGENPVGRYLRVDGSNYLITGVLKENNSGYNSQAMVPTSTLKTVYHLTDVSTMVFQSVGLEKTKEYEKYEKKFFRSMSQVKEFHPEDKSALFMYGGGAQSEQMNMAFGAIRNSFWILGILTLLSGVTGVGNIMLISVRERTHEFGIRKAIGATPWQIIFMVLTESVLITTFFGYIGMVLGVAFCEYMDRTAGNSAVGIGEFTFHYFQDPTVGLDICIEATLVMILAGAIAGFIPARQAALVKPVEALSK